MSRAAAFVVLMVLALVFSIGGWMQLRQGLEILRRGEAWHRIQERPMTTTEWRLSVGVLIVTGVLGLGGAAVVVWVLVVAY